MERKEIIIKNLKRLLAAAVFLTPCALYLILLRHRAGDSLLYTAPYQWWVIALSFAAGIFSYIILRREKPCPESDGTDDFSYTDNTEKTVSPPIQPDLKIDPDEYPELFSDRDTESEDEKKYDITAGISAAISLQKSEPINNGVESDADRNWEEYSRSADKEEFTYPKELYENIPELPKDYEIKSSDEEEKEYSLNFTVRKSHIGESVLSKVLCVFIAAAIAVGAALAASLSCNTENDTGFSIGKSTYLFSDVKSYTVSQKLLGSLSVEVMTGDGHKAELFPATLFKGEKFSEKYDSIYAYMAHAIRQMKNSGAAESIKDKEDIIRAFKDTEDGSRKYIEEIIGENIK